MLTFRDITAADRDIVLPMVEAFYHTDAVTHAVPTAIMERAFQAAADPAEPLLRGVLVYEGDKLAGYVYLTQCYSAEVGGRCIFIEEIFLNPPFRGRGLGRAIMDWIHREYPDVRRLRLEVTQVNQSAIAPDVVGMMVEDGRVLAQREDLNWQQTDINHDSLPTGTIISQIPEANKPMRKGDSLLVTVSLGPANSAMPDMYGLAYEDAVQRLNTRGFGSIVAVKTVSTSPAGTVLSQLPLAGDPFTVGQTVELTISGGSTMVPELTGRTREEAASLLAESSLTEAVPVFVETSDPTQVGLVLAQTPVSGTMAVVGAPVTLSIGIESQPYQGEVAVSLPDADYERRVRITLMADGEEKVEYEGTVAADMQSVMLVPISSNTEGEQTCRIYVDGELFSEEVVLLY